MAAALLAFPWSFNDFVITFSWPGWLLDLALRIYSMIRLGVSPMVNALGTLIVVIPLLVVILGTLVAQRRGKGASTRRMSPSASVELVHVGKRFSAALAVHDLTLTIYQGEFFALLGQRLR